MPRKILLSFLSGLIIFIATWIYQNYSFSFSAEDAFINKISFWKYKIFSTHPQQKTNLVFINTGKDLALVDDTADNGNIAVSDREKLYHFLHAVNSYPNKPAFTVLDLQFYYPYSIDPKMDDSMRIELAKNDRLMIAVIPDGKTTNYRAPLYNALYGYSEYITYGSGFNKFRIINHRGVQSIPVLLDERVGGNVYKDYGLLTTCNGQLCMSAIWPGFYVTNYSLKNNRDTSFAQYYTLGAILTDMEANADQYAHFFDNKVIIIGNFELDTHPTPIGTMAGSVVVANIYLSLLNKTHIVSILFLIISLVFFSGLSYVAWFSKVPEIKVRLNFIFSPHIVKFIKSYISYFGGMFLLSVIALLFFNIQIALFMPAFVFSAIEYFRLKKYLPEK